MESDVPTPASDYRCLVINFYATPTRGSDHGTTDNVDTTDSADGADGADGADSVDTADSADNVDTTDDTTVDETPSLCEVDRAPPNTKLTSALTNFRKQFCGGTDYSADDIREISRETNIPAVVCENFILRAERLFIKCERATIIEGVLCIWGGKYCIVAKVPCKYLGVVRVENDDRVFMYSLIARMLINKTLSARSESARSESARSDNIHSDASVESKNAINKFANLSRVKLNNHITLNMIYSIAADVLGYTAVTRIGDELYLFNHADISYGIEHTNGKKLCQVCGADPSTVGAYIYKCSTCLAARYCSRECQCNDWQDHKKICH